MGIKCMKKGLLFYKFMIILQSCIFGFSFIVLKQLINHGYPTFTIIGCRFFVGALALLFSCVIAPKASPLAVRCDKKSIGFGVISGAIMLVAYFLQTYGAIYTSPANNAFCTALYVIFVPLIGLVYNRIEKKKNLFVLFAATTSLIGVSMISGFSFREMSSNIGDMLSICCGLFFAIHFIIMEKFTPQVNIPIYTISQLFTVSIIAMNISFFMEQKLVRLIDLRSGLFSIFFLGIISTSLTYIIQSFAQAKITANVVSVLSCSEPLFALVFSLALGYTAFSTELLLGSILILVAMVMASFA